MPSLERSHSKESSSRLGRLQQTQQIKKFDGAVLFFSSLTTLLVGFSLDPCDFVGRSLKSGLSPNWFINPDSELA
ncbi:hypothetical protein AQUCO_01300660v1 [Aquilegia coerulea]|uniref:Uncharacterized protein n=1 Tax=Aquilegia coerulea TaxID=218851 RepID=A0A2G5E2V1_AQUCA|nr:hypothetical protein AQUCO_01300660v1 [Aquilegia coerulea]